MMIEKTFGYLYGLRFLDRNMEPILTCGIMVEDQNCTNKTKFKMQEFTLRFDQHIVGFKSVSGFYESAIH